MSREALLYDPLPDAAARCNVCQRRCLIAEGRLGWCQTRLNRQGRLYSQIYGRVASVAVSPIEKKPVFHFFPGSSWLSLGSLGCNFRCPGCQNWELAHYTAASDAGSRPPSAQLDHTQFISAEDLLALAKRRNCFGISWTYNEPTLWLEYTLDGARLAKANGLCTNYVSNGYMTPEALDLIGPYLDVLRVDIKAFSKSVYAKIAHIADFQGILEITKRAKQRWGIWVEVVTNVTPGYSDDLHQLRALASWIRRDLGPDTPWHVTRFFPHLDLSHLEPTPISLLEKARDIGLGEGLRYVYLGNVPGHPAENTYCPKCKALLISREGIFVRRIMLTHGKCPQCETEIAGRYFSDKPATANKAPTEKQRRK